LLCSFTIGSLKQQVLTLAQSLSLGFEEEVRDGDTVIEKEGVKIYVDGKSLFYLSGSEMDYSDGLSGKGFVFNNPNATKTCGCGESCGI